VADEAVVKVIVEDASQAARRPEQPQENPPPDTPPAEAPPTPPAPKPPQPVGPSGVNPFTKSPDPEMAKMLAVLDQIRAATEAGNKSLLEQLQKELNVLTGGTATPAPEPVAPKLPSTALYKPKALPKTAVYKRDTALYQPPKLPKTAVYKRDTALYQPPAAVRTSLKPRGQGKTQFQPWQEKPDYFPKASARVRYGPPAPSRTPRTAIMPRAQSPLATTLAKPGGRGKTMLAPPGAMPAQPKPPPLPRTPAPLNQNVAAGQMVAAFASALRQASISNYVTPEYDASVTVQKAARDISVFGAAVSAINPTALGPFIMGMGFATASLAAFQHSLDGFVRRYAEWSPAITGAEMRADAARIIGDARRAEQAAPSITAYINERSRLNEQIEDAKIRMLEAITPAVIAGMRLIETTIVPMIEGGVKTLSDILEWTPFIGTEIRQIRKEIEKSSLTDIGDWDPTELIRKGYIATDDPFDPADTERLRPRGIATPGA
jgi:hypothetical protein